jgi:iron(III) transport system ATP-binding protein
MDQAEGDGHVSVAGVVKRYGAFTALGGVSFRVDRGEFVSVLGPSGCGKTTILRVISGLDHQDAGTVRIGGADVSRLPVSRRNVGIVFQSYALFPNLSAADNVAYGLRRQVRLRDKRLRRVKELLTLVGLTGLGDKFPAQLSGGQQQRVALARAMALAPDILLLDEPLSALDAAVRTHLRGEIKDLQRRLGVTTLMVTHDQEEALTMADRILVLHDGRLAQEGTPRDIYDRPATPFVASFIGSMNFLPGACKRADGAFDLAGIVLDAGREPTPLAEGEKALLAIRPEDVVLRALEVPGRDGPRARVRRTVFRGPSLRVSLALTETLPELPIEADVPAGQASALGLTRGMIVRLLLPSERVSAYQAP